MSESVNVVNPCSLSPLADLRRRDGDTEAHPRSGLWRGGQVPGVREEQAGERLSGPHAPFAPGPDCPRDFAFVEREGGAAHMLIHDSLFSVTAVLLNGHFSTSHR